MSKSCFLCQQILSEQLPTSSVNSDVALWLSARPHAFCLNCQTVLQARLATCAPTQLEVNFQSIINGLLTSAEIRAIRLKLALTQRQAARICGGGPNAFSRYERGQAPPSRATSNLLKLLAKYPRAVKMLLKN